MTLRILDTGHHSLRVGPLTEGCKRCVKGEKLVVFVTGVCPARCFYCPISKEKKQKDVIYANERCVRSDADVLAEAHANMATGAGLTGGDPLARLERTCRYIRLLKKEFGKKFHIHLYTPFNLVTEERLKMLYGAGLDEIRFHPDLEDKTWWNRIHLARDYDWDVGVEIPVLPDKVEETTELLFFLDKKINFLNLNELEISDLNQPFFAKLGYATKSYGSYGVKGSDAAAKLLLAFIIAKKLSYSVHYCTCTLKDLVQMGNRLRRRAENTKLPFDVVDDEGIVFRGAIYHHLIPGFGYERLIEHLDDGVRLRELKELELVKTRLEQTFKLEDGSIILDSWKPRLLVSAAWLKRNFKRIPYPSALVREYPTFDSFPIEIEFLKR